MPATLQPIGEQAPLHDTMGAIMLGVVVSAVLYGIAAVQTLYYFTRYPKDAWYIKALVTITLFLDTVHLGLITHTMYHYTITRYYDHESLHRITASVILEALCTGITGCLVQGFYTMRVWRLGSKTAVMNKILVLVIALLIMGCTGCGTAWVIIALQMKTFQELLSITPLTITINALSAAADVIIAASLCIMLQRSRTGFRGSDSMINKLTLFVINTGLLTSICAVASLISLIASPNTLIYATFYFCIGRIYTNSLLASICVRKSIRNGFDDSHMMSPIPSGVLSPTDTHTEPHRGHARSSLVFNKMGTIASTNTHAHTHSFNGGGKGGNIAIRIDTTMEEYTHDEDKAAMSGTTDASSVATITDSNSGVGINIGVLGPYHQRPKTPKRGGGVL